jgi:hypothetical protein
MPPPWSSATRSGSRRMAMALAYQEQRPATRVWAAGRSSLQRFASSSPGAGSGITDHGGGIRYTPPRSRWEASQRFISFGSPMKTAVRPVSTSTTSSVVRLQPGRSRALLVGIYHQHAAPGLRPGDGEIDREGRLRPLMPPMAMMRVMSRRHRSSHGAARYHDFAHWRVAGKMIRAWPERLSLSPQGVPAATTTSVSARAR